MRVLFVVLLSLLLVGSVVTYLSFPEAQKEPRVLYWVIDGIPARKHQAEVFEKWMADNGYPAVDLRIEVSKSYKVNVVQGVSGLAGDNRTASSVNRRASPNARLAGLTQPCMAICT